MSKKKKKKNYKKTTKNNRGKRNNTHKKNNINKNNNQNKRKQNLKKDNKKKLKEENIKVKKEIEKKNNIIEKKEKIKEIKLEKPKIKDIKQDKKKIKIHIFLIYFITLIFLELIFRIFCTEKFLTYTTIYTLIYIIPISLLLTIITSSFSDKINNLVSKILILLITLWYMINLVYKLKMGVFFSINSLGLANQLTSFLGDTFSTIAKHSFKLLIMLIPFILAMILNKKTIYMKRNKKSYISYIGIFIVSLLIFYSTLFINKNKEYSMYKLYFKVSNNSLTVEKSGVLISTSIELKEKIFNYKDDELTINIEQTKEELVEEIKYNVLDIDFDTLSENTTDKIKKQMNEYFKNETPTNQNEYTGLYEGKNLILIMAESFNSFAISEELTPTLYKLTNESFVFENFYSPVILSTIGGEFQELTGLYPHINLLGGVWRRGTNYYQYGFGNVFKNENYQTYAYHNNQYNFQNRDKYLKSIGFDNYIGCGNGLEDKINCNIWPESDSEMIETTVSDYINSDTPFMTYYVTVSGHMAYNWSNEMSKKHKDKVESLDLPENVKAYIATQIELDEALSILIEKLEEAGKLDDTVIALVGDHYPYDLDISDINKASSYERDSIIEINHSNFILWNSKTKTTNIKKVGSQIDVLPTLLNLFGIEYDSRLIIGKDILANNEGLAIFANGSWVSDKGKYYSSTNKFEANEGEEVTEEYINNMNTIVNNKITMSKYILQEDYYNYIFKEQEN